MFGRQIDAGVGLVLLGQGQRRQARAVLRAELGSIRAMAGGQRCQRAAQCTTDAEGRMGGEDDAEPDPLDPALENLEGDGRIGGPGQILEQRGQACVVGGGIGLPDIGGQAFRPRQEGIARQGADQPVDRIQRQVAAGHAARDVQRQAPDRVHQRVLRRLAAQRGQRLAQIPAQRLRLLQSLGVHRFFLHRSLQPAPCPGAQAGQGPKALGMVSAPRQMVVPGLDHRPGLDQALGAQRLRAQ